MNVGLKRMARSVIGPMTIALCLAAANGATAETLSDALVWTYGGNPKLKAERARQRGTDELVPQALSGWRPTIAIEGAAGYDRSDTSDTPEFDDATARVAITLTQPLFRGFKTVNGTKAAKANVRAGRQYLLAIEQDIIFQTVQAYMNVVRDRQILSLRQKIVSALKQQLRSANDRLAAGQITPTDIAQARARVAGARAELEAANATLSASLANYERVVGRKPGKLKSPKVPRLPRTLADAQAAAKRINPNILAAAFVEEASHHEVEVAKGDLLPEISLSASAGYDSFPEFDVDSSRSAKIEGVLTIPLYQAGRVHSAIRQSKQVASQRRFEVIEAGRSVRESVAVSWSNFEAARRTIELSKAQIAANGLALEGVRQEYLVGSRTTLDVLDAEREVVATRIALVAAERDQVVAAYQILGSIGQLTARDLTLPVPLHDAEANYRNVEGNWTGTSADTAD
jgi:TolC family type I secretion outer membrane protein